MKRLFFILMSISLVACLYAVPSKKYKFVVKTTDGDFSYALYKQPEMSFTATDVVVTMEQEEVHFSKNALVDFTLEYNQYQVTFLDWDGDTLQSSMVTYGEYPVYNGENPTREPDAQYTYAFTGWSPEVDIVTGTANYYAQFSETLNQYEVNYYNWDGSLLQSSWYYYGEWPSYESSEPWRESDAQYTYTFSGWSPSVDVVTGTANYYAQFSETLNQYKVYYFNWDGTLLQSGWYNYGDYPTYTSSDPWRDSNAQYTYTFTGWSPSVDVVTGTARYYAQFSETLNQYEVNYYNWDGTLLQSNLYNYGDWPTYYGSDPWRDSDAQYTYTFSGWSPVVDVVTGTASYYAQFSETLNRYEVAYYNWDGSLLQSGWYDYGEWPTYDCNVPQRMSDAQYTYTFIGWSPSVDYVTGTANYYAQFSETLNQYEVNYYNWDGSLLQSVWYNYGEWPTYESSEPWRDSDAQYTYTFTGWSPEVDIVTGTANYYAQFSGTLNRYEVTYYNWDGSLLQSSWYDYGEWPTYECNEPQRMSDAQYTYTFSGWSPEVDVVTGTASYYAQFSGTLNRYEVTYYNWDGSLLQSGWYNYGDYPTYTSSEPWRDADAQYTYTFTGWSPEVDVVTGTASYYAQFSETLRQYEVTFLDWDAIVLKQELVDYGASATAPDNPIREGYDFVGWDTDYSYIISDLTVTAQYEKQVGTSIGSKETETQKSPTKILENGILYIVLPDGTRYNAQGATL